MYHLGGYICHNEQNSLEIGTLNVLLISDKDHTGGKIIPAIKWQKTWLNFVLVFCLSGRTYYSAEIYKQHVFKI